MISYRANAIPPAPWLRPIPPPPKLPKRVGIPEEITDPLAREILDLVRRAQDPWSTIEARAGVGISTLRWWFYRPRFNPNFAGLQAVLGVLGYRLRLERVE